MSSLASSRVFSCTGTMTATSSATRVWFAQVALDCPFTPVLSVSLTHDASGMVARTGLLRVLVPIFTVGNACSAVLPCVAALMVWPLYSSLMSEATSALVMPAIADSLLFHPPRSVLAGVVTPVAARAGLPPLGPSRHPWRAFRAGWQSGWRAA